MGDKKVPAASLVVRLWLKAPVTLSGVAALTIASVAADLALPWFVATLLAGIRHQESNEWRELINLSGVMSAAVCSKALLFHLLARLLPRSMSSLAAELFNRSVRQPVSWHGRVSAASLQQRVMNAVWRGGSALNDAAFVSLVPSILFVVGAAGVVAVRLPYCGTLWLLMLALIIWCDWKLAGRLATDSTTAVLKAEQRIFDSLIDALRSQLSVRTYGRESDERARIWHLSRCYIAKGASFEAGSLKLEALHSLFVLLFVVAQIGTAIYANDEVAAAFVVMSITLTLAQLKELPSVLQRLQEGLSILRDLDLTFGEASDQSVVGREVLGDEFRPSIRFEGVKFSYDNNGNFLFSGLDFEIGAGERVAFVGASGSGKSTVVRILQRLLPISGGRVVLGGHDLMDVEESSLRRAIALVPQEAPLLNRTIFQNIAFGDPDASASAVLDAARRAGADDFIRQLPEGYETEVTDGGANMSGGQKQRVLIARALLANAKVIILDEATASLDLQAEELIQSTIAAIPRDRTVVIIAHRLSAVRLVDRIIVLDAGEVREQGTHVELINVDGPYKKLHDLWRETSKGAPAHAAV